LAPISKWAATQLQAKEGRPYLFDANPRNIYDKNHLPTAQWVPDEGVSATLLPKDKAQALIFYCAERRCLNSHIAAEKVLALGWRNVSIMPDGIFGWVKAGMPTESTQ
jgi:rhodanese-related sulfurtransferase